MIVKLNGKPNITAALCDSICPADKSGCCCHIMAFIWKLDEMSRNKFANKSVQRLPSLYVKTKKMGVFRTHRAGTLPSKIIKEVLSYNKSVQTKATREGIENEDLIISQYTENMQKGSIHVHFLYIVYGFLGASPDGDQ